MKKKIIKNIIIKIYFIQNKDIIKIFGKSFVEGNKKKCRIIMSNKEKELNNYIETNEEELKIKLEIYEYIISIKEMFKECQEIRKVNKLNIFYVNDMSGLFYFCSSLSSLPDISKWNTNNVKIG